MMESNSELKFKISSALKNIIGKELITDQYIAIFELVKNAFDANARKVKIVFESIKQRNSRIVIIDDGKGMNYDDLISKWLFVAYSAKKDGTEDKVTDEPEILGVITDYRNKIKSKRVFAGAKGVGRFSCDRLGNILNMITVKNRAGALIENLEINWEDFEENAKKEFVEIPIKHKILSNNIYNISHGTILEIYGLRDLWNRNTILKLKYSLEKLINPNQENGSDEFSIEIIAEEEADQDKYETKEKNKVNGIIKNNLFETLNLKTTQVIVEISSDGRLITTTLKDRGTLIYRISEKNPYSISDIKVHLFQLNKAAKINFTRLMGIEPVNYGSVFMYKNGFRIYPFGEPGEDTLDIDRRKAQRYNSRLGTRDLIGRIEIYGNNENLKETTSRDGGLIKNQSYEKLVDFFYEKALKRLEKYVVDIIKWGDPYKMNPEDREYQPALNPDDVRQEIRSIIQRLSNSHEFISVEHDEKFLEIIEKNTEESVSEALKDLSKHALEKNDQKLFKKVERLNKDVKELVVANTELEKEAEQKEVVLKQVTEELTQKERQNLFLKSVTTLDFDNIVSLHHQIGIYANDIDAQLLIWNRRLNRGSAFTEEDNRALIENIGFLNKKILSISRFATKANFNLQSEEIQADLITFIEQYVENIYSSFTDNSINISFDNRLSGSFTMKFKPIEITIILDNLINNSRKSNARNLSITVDRKGTEVLILRFKDDGLGLSKTIKDKSAIFEKGFSTTSGSGLGLYHISQILRDMNGTINVNTNVEKGIEFVLEVHK